MALIGNNSLLNRLPLRHRGGGTTAVGNDRAGYSLSGSNRNQCLGSYTKYSSTPNGYNIPGAWILPQTIGGMTSVRQIKGLGTLTANLAGGINVVSSITASGDVTSAVLRATGSLISALTASGDITASDLTAISLMVAALTATGDITTADLNSVILAFASITASGDITTANLAGSLNASASITAAGDITTTLLGARVNLSSSITASGDITTALAEAILQLSAALTAAGSVSTAVLRGNGELLSSIICTLTVTDSSTVAAVGNLTADILPYTELSPESLAHAVWSSLPANYTTSGEFGTLVKQIKALVAAGL